MTPLESVLKRHDTVRHGHVIVAALAVTLAGCSPSTGADSQPMDGEGIRLHPVFTVQGEDHPALPGPVLQAAVNDCSEFSFVFYPTHWAIQRFDSLGNHLGAFGNEGEGPGEFQSVGPILHRPGDSTWVFDGSLARWTVFDGNWKPTRTFPGVGDMRDVVELPGNRFVLANPYATGQLPMYPLHVMDAEGQIDRSFGTDEPESDPRRDWRVRRAIASATGGGFWAAHHYNYVLDRYDDRTELVNTLRRITDWFPEIQAPSSSLSERPNPFILAVRDDGLGHLWVLVAVPEPDWEEAIPSGAAGATEGRVDTDALLGTRLEVLDTESGDLIAHLYTNDLLNIFLENGAIVGYAENGRGVPIVTVWRGYLVNQ